MTTKHGFPPDDRSPLFLSENSEQPDIGKAWETAVISSRILKTVIFAIAVTAIGIAVLSMGNPVALLANVAASWGDKPALQSGIDSSMSAIQSVAGTGDPPPTASDTPERVEIAAAPEPADQSRAEIGRPPAEGLLKQFQSWATEDDTQAPVAPAQPVQGAPAQVVQGAPAKVAQEAPARVAQVAPAQVRPAKKHRRARSLHNARAEIRSQRNSRALVREEQNARTQAAPAPEARAQDQPVQNPLTPWLLQSLGWRN